MKHENGSIIVWVFVAMLLFAALSFIMMQGSRTSGSMIGTEQARAYASQMIGYGQELKSAVQRLKMRGCTDNQFGFGNSVWVTNAGTPLMSMTHNPTATDTCQVFSIAGGGMTPAVFNDNGVPPTPANTKSGHSTLISLSIAGVGTPANDLVMITFYVDKKTCLEINDRLGITNPGGNPAQDDLNGMTSWFDGTYAGTAVIGDDAPEFTGHGTGCFSYLNGGVGLENYDFHFYQVLVAR